MAVTKAPSEWATSGSSYHQSFARLPGRLGASAGATTSSIRPAQGIYPRATLATVSQVRVVTSLPKVFSISVMKTAPLGLGRYAL